jgi:uncharacterized protein (DUF924 family)
LASNVFEAAWVSEILHFWFDEPEETQWFAKSDAIDSQIRGRFSALHRQVVAGDGSIAMTKRPLLAAVIILDQFSRHLFRARHVLSRPILFARELSRAAVKQRFDDAMDDHERLFLHLPFEHSEDPKERSSLNSAGFPHRNAILNRPSSHDDVTSLQQPKAWWF